MKLYFFLPFFLVVAACSKVECYSENLSIDYKLDSLSMSMVVVNRYAPGTNFSELIYQDTIALTSAAMMNIPHGVGEKNGITYTNYNGIWLDAAYDWEISFPLSNRTDRISNILERADKQKSGHGGVHDVCYNSYTYTFNGEKMATERISYNQATVVVH